MGTGKEIRCLLLLHLTGLRPHLVGRLLMILIVSQEQSWVMDLRAEQHCWVGGTVDPGTTDGAHETSLSSCVPQVSAASTVWGFSGRPRNSTARRKAKYLVKAIFLFLFFFLFFELSLYSVAMWSAQIYSSILRTVNTAWITYATVFKAWFQFKRVKMSFGWIFFLWV